MADNNEENQVNDDEIDAQIQSVNAEIARLEGAIDDKCIVTDGGLTYTAYRDGHYMARHKTESADSVKNWYSEKATAELIKGGAIVGGIVGVVGTAIVCHIFGGKNRH